MKTPALSRILRSTLFLLCLLASARVVCAQKIPLISNGDFAAKGLGKVSTPPCTADGTGLPGYRLFNIADQFQYKLDFSGTIFKDSRGTNAVRLDVNNSYNAVPQGIYGFDVFDNRIAIKPGTTYSYSFDAAYISGGNNLTVVLAEFDASGAFVGEQFVHPYHLTKTDTLFHTYTGVFAPTAGNAATVDITFVPCDAEAIAGSISLANIRFGPAAPGAVKPPAK